MGSEVDQTTIRLKVRSALLEWLLDYYHAEGHFNPEKTLPPPQVRRLQILPWSVALEDRLVKLVEDAKEPEDTEEDDPYWCTSCESFTVCELCGVCHGCE